MSELIELLESMRLEHTVVEDCWYSCPKSGDEFYCGESSTGNCNCGADEHNAKVDRAIALVRAATGEAPHP